MRTPNGPDLDCPAPKRGIDDDADWTKQEGRTERTGTKKTKQGTPARHPTKRKAKETPKSSPDDVRKLMEQCAGRGCRQGVQAGGAGRAVQARWCRHGWSFLKYFFNMFFFRL